MTRTVTLAVVLALAALLVPGRGARAYDASGTLKGVPAFYVQVEAFTEPRRQAGFEKATFRTDVELKLRLAGIKVRVLPRFHGHIQEG